MNLVLKLALLYFVLTEDEAVGRKICVRAEEAYRELEYSRNSNKFTSTAADDVKQQSFQYEPPHIPILDKVNSAKWQNQITKLVILRKRKRTKIRKRQDQWPLIIRSRRSSGAERLVAQTSEDIKAVNSSKEINLVNVWKNVSLTLGCSPNCSNSEPIIKMPHITNDCVRDCHSNGETAKLCQECSQICYHVHGASSKCGCYHGYAIGADWQHCIDIDECSIKPWLCHGGTCLNTVGSYLCRCHLGYHLIGQMCVDINECSTTRGEQLPCHQVCVNVPGTYHCWCHKGFVPSANNSQSCIDINECTQRVCTHDCVNTVGSFRCKCPPNMSLHANRRTCIPATTTMFSVSLAETNSSLIIERSGEVDFKKETSYFPSATIHLINPKDIKNRNHSIEEKGLNGSQTPANASAAYSSPPEVYIKNNNTDAKQEQPRLYGSWRQTLLSQGFCIPACRNGGICGENRKCNCRSGFQGHYCQIDVNECLRAPPVCGRSVCVNSIGSYQCLCPAGYMLSSDNMCVAVYSKLAKLKSMLVNENSSVREGTNIAFDAASKTELSSDSLHTSRVSKSRILESETPNVLPNITITKISNTVLAEITGSEESAYSQYFNATNVPTPSLESTSTNALNVHYIPDLLSTTSVVTSTSASHNLFSFILGPNPQKQSVLDVSQLKVIDQGGKSAVFATLVSSRISHSIIPDENPLGPNYSSLNRTYSDVPVVTGSLTAHSTESRKTATGIPNVTAGYSQEDDRDNTQELNKLGYTSSRKHSRRYKQKHIGETFIDERKNETLGRESRKHTGGKQFKKGRKQFIKLTKDFHVLNQMLEDTEEPTKLQTRCTGTAKGKSSHHTSRNGEQCIEVIDNEDEEYPVMNTGRTFYNESYLEAPAPLYALKEQQKMGAASNTTKQKHCYYRNKRIRSRKAYWDDKNCTKCLCKGGKLHCRSYRIAADCCKLPQNAVCCEHNPINCLVNGEVYLSGETFVPVSDPCMECQCKNGNITCSLRSCPTECSHPYKTAHDCCPRCRHCYFNGRKISNGASMTTNNGTCQKCICKQGHVTCKNARCERSCVIRGSRIPSGAEFHIGSDSCTQCRCWNGSVSCQAVECRTTCSHGVLLPNRCCLDCSKCDYKGELYTENEDFEPKEELCKKCTCTKGNVTCWETCSILPEPS